MYSADAKHVSGPQDERTAASISLKVGVGTEPFFRSGAIWHCTPPPHDPALDPFMWGLAVLRLNGQTAGHLATTLGSFSSLFPRQMRPWVHYIAIWSDGTREPAEEDYPPWTFIREMQDGYFSGPRPVRYEAAWLEEPDRSRMWGELGVSAADF